MTIPRFNMSHDVINLSDGSEAFRHRLRVIALQVAVILCLAGGAAGSSSAAVQVIVSNETVPPGGTVQLKFSLSQPILIASGELAMDLDPTVFGSATSASVFGANGDAAGVAQIQGLHVDVRFSSQNGGIGRLSGVPIVVVTARILPTAVAGKITSVTADPSGSPWLGLSMPNPNGGIILPPPYSVSVSPGTVTIGGTLSISSITPGGGVLPGGTVIQIQGTGFNSATTAQINGASVASVQVAGPQMMSLTLGGPTELTGKRIGVTNPDGSEVDTFAFAPAAPVSSPGTPLDGTIPILPLQEYTAIYATGNTFVSIRNPNATAVQLVLDTISPNGIFQNEQPFTISMGGSLLLQTPNPQAPTAMMIASAPVQIVQLTEVYSTTSGTYQLSASAPSEAVVRRLQVAATTQDTPLNAGAPDAPSSLSWAWQTGTSAPEAKTIEVGLPKDQPSTDYKVSVATSSGGPWLSVTPSGTIKCQPGGTVGQYPGGCVILEASVKPGSLAPGIYRGAVTITPVGTIFRPEVEAAVIPIALTVTASPPTQILFSTGVSLSDLTPNTSYSASVSVPPGMFAGPVSVSVVTYGNGNWLSATPNSAIAPTSITVVTNFTGRSVRADVVVTGSGNTLVIPVTVYQSKLGSLLEGGGVGHFVVQEGAGPPPAQIGSGFYFQNCVSAICPASAGNGEGVQPLR